MGRTGTRVSVAAIVLAAALLALSASALAGGKPKLIANCAKTKPRPLKVILACGDASFVATGVLWTSWGQKTATGTGTGQVNDCTPDCVQGHTKTAPIQLQLSKVRRCARAKSGKRPLLFTKVTWTWTREVPQGFPATGSTLLGCKLLPHV